MMSYMFTTPISVNSSVKAVCSVKVVVGAIFKTRGLCLNTCNFVTISHTNVIASRYIDLPFPCILVWLTN